MITTNIYRQGIDHSWYDSSNVLYSKCYDNEGPTKPLKIVFKNGRTYMYKDVDANDYMLFKQSGSNGQAFSQYIKKYECKRIQDTDLDKLEEFRKTMIGESEEISDSKMNDLVYTIEYVDKTGDFALKYGDKVLYKGAEGKVSILNLFKSMNIRYTMIPTETIENKTDEKEDFIEI